MTDFEKFPKIARLARDMIITEKLDGTNAQVRVSDNGVFVVAGSRNQYIEPGKATDNFGFAGWVKEHFDELLTLGPGRHFGEWWGPGIQRGYGVAEKRFSLFNVHRWGPSGLGGVPGIDQPPACCHVVPVLHTGPFDTHNVQQALAALQFGGSVASPGFMRPEGIVVFHKAANTLFKMTIGDDGRKSV